MTTNVSLVRDGRKYRPERRAWVEYYSVFVNVDDDDLSSEEKFLAACEAVREVCRDNEFPVPCHPSASGDPYWSPGKPGVNWQFMVKGS